MAHNNNNSSSNNEDCLWVNGSGDFEHIQLDNTPMGGGKKADLADALEAMEITDASEAANHNDLAVAVHAKMAEMQAEFQAKMDAMQRKHDGELDGLRKEISVLTLASFHGPLEILKHLKPEFVEFKLFDNTENTWDWVSNEFSVSGNSVTKNGNSRRSICSKSGFERISSSSNPRKHLIVFDYFEITIDAMRRDYDIRIGLASESFPMEFLGTRANSFGIDNEGHFCQYGICEPGFGSGGFARGDTVGCGLMAVQSGYVQNPRWIFFTKNGKIWGTLVALSLSVPSILIPTVSIFEAGAKVTANFGNEPFKYGIPPAEGLLD